MAKRRRSSDFNISDIPLIFSNPTFAIVFACCGLAEIIAYYAFEPGVGDSTSPISLFPHIFWEAIAVIFYCPGVAMLVLGLLGMAVCWVRNAWNTEYR